MFSLYPYLNMNDLNLDFILNHYKDFDAALASLDSWRSEHEEEYNELKKMVDDLENGHWSNEFIATLINWYRDNIVDIMGAMAKMVIFNITDDGYFVAYIPESWSDLHFGTTGLDDFPAGVDYGHLTIFY